MSAVMIATAALLIASTASHQASQGSYSPEPMPVTMLPMVGGVLMMLIMLIPMIICMGIHMEAAFGSRRERWSERGVNWCMVLALVFPIAGALASGIWQLSK
ncbi:hypothetical protein Kallioja_00017 [Pseudomonas phage vB_PpuP-Kallioja]